MKDMIIHELYDLNKTIAKELFIRFQYPWEVLDHIETFIHEIGETLPIEDYERRDNNVWIHKSAKIFSSAYLGANIIVGKNAEIRHCSFVRNNAIIGNGVIVGNSTELKNVILFDSVEVPHYNYVGDSILGYKVHMGAGSITSNVKADKENVKVHALDGDFDTCRMKVGAMIGDYAEIGCGAVLNPGTVIGKHSNVYPLSNVRGCVSAYSIYKKQGEIADKR